MKLVTNEEKFLEQFSARARQYADLVKAGELPVQYACFDLLSSIYSAIEGGMEGDRITSAYPMKDWQERTVEVPQALLRPIVESWMEYGLGNKKLGEAFQIEGGGQGKRLIKRLREKADRDIRLSNKVVCLLVDAKHRGAPISQDAAFQTIVEVDGEQYETVRKAFQKYGRDTLDHLEAYREKLRKIST
ncbi:hypothetical protein ACM25N_11080 [Roseovarius sp. C7]|uniref:hypothetical protein n=1 Tax=Roseovarius sp. C7 TaxID=3398643 RepID=UPI0039F715DC